MHATAGRRPETLVVGAGRWRGVLVAALMMACGCAPTGPEGKRCEDAQSGETQCFGTQFLRCTEGYWTELAACASECVAGHGTTHDVPELTSDETWACADGGHYVPNPITVAPGVTLTIGKGARVSFDSLSSISAVDGTARIVVEGEAGAEVLFTSDNGEGGVFGTTQVGGVNVFASSSSAEPSSFAFAIVERGINGLGVFGLEEGKTAPVIESSIFRDNLKHGILVRGCVGEPTVPDYAGAFRNQFVQNGTDVSVCDPGTEEPAE